jgi:hypothetical protein
MYGVLERELHGEAFTEAFGITRLGMYGQARPGSSTFDALSGQELTADVGPRIKSQFDVHRLP